MTTNPSLCLICHIRKPHKKSQAESSDTEPSEQDYLHLNMLLDFTAGCLGGMAGVVVGQPLDTVKVHMQTQSAKNPIYKGIWHCMSSLIKQDGIKGLYRGMSSPMAGVGAVNAIVFGIYGNVQRNFENPDSLWSHGTAGALAGFVQSFVCSPIELAKTRLQLQNKTSEGKKFRSPSECMLHIMRTEGIRGTFRGLLTTIYRDVPAFGSYFVSYELMMSMFAAPNALHSFMAGGFAGMVSWVCCYPTDVVKSIMQADGMQGHFKYKGIMDCIRQNYKADGIKFFFRGFNSTIIRAFPTNAACFSIVSLFMRIWKGSGIDVVVHPNEPIILMCLDHSPLHVYDELEHEMQRKRSLLLNSMRALHIFNEGVCHSELEDIVNEFYPIYHAHDEIWKV